MKRSLVFSFAAALLAVLTIVSTGDAAAQSKTQGKSLQHQFGPFDDDGDGIPNHSDPNYTRPQDGTGRKFGTMRSAGNDGLEKGKKYGPGDGTGYKGVGPRDGSGFGKTSGAGTGVCDGTGPKGSRRGK